MSHRPWLTHSPRRPRRRKALKALCRVRPGEAAERARLIYAPGGQSGISLSSASSSVLDFSSPLPQGPHRWCRATGERPGSARCPLIRAGLCHVVAGLGRSGSPPNSAGTCFTRSLGDRSGVCRNPLKHPLNDSSHIYVEDSNLILNVPSKIATSEFACKSGNVYLMFKFSTPLFYRTEIDPLSRYFCAPCMFTLCVNSRLSHLKSASVYSNNTPWA